MDYTEKHIQDLARFVKLQELERQNMDDTNLPCKIYSNCLDCVPTACSSYIHAKEIVNKYLPKQNAKPLSIDELKNIAVRDWVYIICDKKDSIGNYLGECYYRKENTLQGEEDKEFACGFRGYSTAFMYSDYGKTWTAYKNKEQMDSK